MEDSESEGSLFCLEVSKSPISGLVYREIIPLLVFSLELNSSLRRNVPSSKLLHHPMVPSTPRAETGLGEAALFVLLLSLITRVPQYLSTQNIFLLENTVLLDLMILIRDASCGGFCSKNHHGVI